MYYYNPKPKEQGVNKLHEVSIKSDMPYCNQHVEKKLVTEMHRNLYKLLTALNWEV